MLVFLGVIPILLPLLSPIAWQRWHRRPEGENLVALARRFAACGLDIAPEAQRLSTEALEAAGLEVARPEGKGPVAFNRRVAFCIFSSWLLDFLRVFLGFALVFVWFPFGFSLVSFWFSVVSVGFLCGVSFLDTDEFPLSSF